MDMHNHFETHSGWACALDQLHNGRCASWVCRYVIISGLSVGFCWAMLSSFDFLFKRNVMAEEDPYTVDEVVTQIAQHRVHL